MRQFYLGEQRVLVLDAVSLIDDDVPPVELLKVVLFLDHHLVRSHTSIKWNWEPKHGFTLLSLHTIINF